MSKKFNLADYLKDTTPVSNSDTEQIVRIDLDLIDPDPSNFYSLEGIDELAGNIETVGLLDALRVRPAGDRYVVVSGHRRRAACMLIRDGGSEMFAAGVPCIIEYGEASDAMRELRLIYANSATRVMSAADLSRQAERVTELLYQLKEQGVEFPGRMRDHVAQACKVSASKIARLHAIRENLQTDLLELFDKGQIAEAAAYELQKLPVGAQAYLGAQQKIRNNGISMYNAERLVKNADVYLHPRCSCPDGSECEQTLARFKQTATCEMTWRSCGGGCCLDCGRSLNDCPCQCARAKKVHEAAKAEKKAEEDRAAQRDEARRERQRARLSVEYGRILALAEAAGLPDKTRLILNDAYSVGELRERARGEGFCSWKLTEHNSPCMNMYAQDLAKTADTLGVSLDFLLGRETPTESVPEPNTEAEWKQGTPPRDGRYLCMVDIGTTRLHEQKCEYRDGEWSCYGRPFSEIGTVEYWWPLPPEKLILTDCGEEEDEDGDEDRV